MSIKEFTSFYKLIMADVFKGDERHAGRASKDRLTVLAATTSGASEKAALSVIEDRKLPLLLG